MPARCGNRKLCGLHGVSSVAVPETPKLASKPEYGERTGSVMTDSISDEAVALSLMREALTLLDEPSNTDAASLLGQAIVAVERLISGEQGVASRQPSKTRQAKHAP